MFENQSKNGRQFLHFFIDFGVILGSQMASKSHPKSSKSDFGPYFFRYFVFFGARTAPGHDFYWFLIVLGSIWGPFLVDFCCFLSIFVYFFAIRNRFSNVLVSNFLPILGNFFGTLVAHTAHVRIKLWLGRPRMSSI